MMFGWVGQSQPQIFFKSFSLPFLDALGYTIHHAHAQLLESAVRAPRSSSRVVPCRWTQGSSNQASRVVQPQPDRHLGQSCSWSAWQSTSGASAASACQENMLQTAAMDLVV